MKKSFVIAFLAGLYLFLSASVILRASSMVQAASPGLTVSPALVSLTIGSQSPEAEARLTLANSYAAPIQVASELRGIDESSAQLLPTSPLSGDTAAALSLSETYTTVPANGTATLIIKAHDNAELASGGHYASLVISDQSTTRGGSTFRPAIAVNVFVVKTDGVRRDLRLDQVKMGHTMFTLPTRTALTFTNRGNTHVTPRASTSLYDERGSLVARSVTNTESRPLFPSRSGTFEAPMHQVYYPLFPKRLTVVTSYRIDGTDVQLLKEGSFWYVPIIDLVTLIFLGAVLWRYRKWLSRLPFRRIFAGLFYLPKALARRTKKLVRAPMAALKKEQKPITIQSDKGDDTDRLTSTELEPLPNSQLLSLVSRLAIYAYNMPSTDLPPTVEKDVETQKSPKPLSKVPKKVSVTVTDTKPPQRKRPTTASKDQRSSTPKSTKASKPSKQPKKTKITKTPTPPVKSKAVKTRKTPKTAVAQKSPKTTTSPRPKKTAKTSAVEPSQKA